MIKWTFNFCRALDALSGGRKVRRKAWDTTAYIVNNTELDCFDIHNGEFWGYWTVNQDDIRAADWEIYEEKTN